MGSPEELYYTKDREWRRQRFCPYLFSNTLNFGLHMTHAGTDIRLAVQPIVATYRKVRKELGDI